MNIQLIELESSNSEKEQKQRNIFRENIGLGKVENNYFDLPVFTRVDFPFAKANFA